MRFAKFALVQRGIFLIKVTRKKAILYRIDPQGTVEGEAYPDIHAAELSASRLAGRRIILWHRIPLRGERNIEFCKAKLGCKFESRALAFNNGASATRF